MDDKIREGREFLKANWKLLEGVQSDQNNGVMAPEVEKPAPEDAVLVDLVSPDNFPKWDKTVMDAVAGRESRRKYTGAPLTLEEISYLLWATQGVRMVSLHFTRRSTPSAGARHSIETYLYVDHIDGIDTGLYRYLPVEHKLCLVSDSEDLDARLNDALFRQGWKPAAVFVWAAVPYRMEWRYSAVSHKLIALDAGHICQNLYIACEALGCGTCAIGAYDQELLDAFIGADGVDEFAVYAAPVGKI